MATQNPFNKRPVLFFLVIPCSISVLMMALFFSGIAPLRQLIVPVIPELHQESWREFGILENIQHLYLLAMALICLYAIKIKPYAWEKVLILCVALFSTWILLEELDYGLHYYEYLFDVPIAEREVNRNFHNQGNRLQNMRRAVDVVMALFFLIAPFYWRNTKKPLLSYLLPNRWMAGTAVAMILLSELAHALYAQGLGAGLVSP